MIIITSVSISIEGLVQGVGFRPFIYRLAKKYKLKGNVVNRTDGVVINICGDEKSIEDFKSDILKHTPPAAFIKKISSLLIEDFISSDFAILPSKETDNLITEISPDIAVCDDCLHDLKNQNHRMDYPFINCTNCGPRFSIINKLPYDRGNTTMYTFEMCKICKHEYHDVLDRRFHAQPVACNNCGPGYLYGDEHNFEKIIVAIGEKIDNGKTVAIKGLGGYNIICDARNDSAVKQLRVIKGRDGKPFAVMFRDIKSAEKYCFLNNGEKEILESWQRPIVILDQKKELCKSINTDLNSMGALLPYLPFHYLLFEKIAVSAIVYTSANNSGEPIISDDWLAQNLLSKKVNAFVSHNREIKNPLDDSVVKVVSGKQQIIRRARGYVPKPIYLNKNVEGIFATGAELKNSFCIGKGQSAIMSQYIGDLKNYRTYDFYSKMVRQFFEIFKFTPKIVTCDWHPEYLSTKFAESFNEKSLNGSRIPIVKVQHHHAHIVSCMAEYQLNEKVIGVCFDGIGYGTDGNIWGGEFLICNNNDFVRHTHFDYVKMPGGDIAVNEPWRMVLAYLNNSSKRIENLECLKKISQNEKDLVQKMLDNNVNSPLTSSAGRIFDAVACLLNLCTKQTFDAEGPMRLEAIVDNSESGFYSFEFENGIINFNKTWDAIVNDLGKKSVSVISAKFHNTVVQVIKDVSIQIRKETGLNKVVLSGGVFQNKYLLEKSIQKLTENNFVTYINRLLPPNDGGIALGQLIVASNII